MVTGNASENDPGYPLPGFPTEEVEDARANVIVDKLRTTLQGGAFRRQDHLIERLLEEGFKENQINGLKIYGPVGCDQCANGYKGRVGIYQVMPITEGISRIILEGGNAMDIVSAR